MKHDSGKAPVARGFSRYFPRAVEAVALISLFGFEKYKEWGGWKKVPDAFNRYDDAHGRHDLALQRGETHCPESHKLHLAHRAWNAFATLELYLLEEEAKLAEETLRKDKSWSVAAVDGVHLDCVKWRADKFEVLKAEALRGLKSDEFKRCDNCADYSCRQFGVCCHPQKFTTCGKCVNLIECSREGRCTQP